MPLLLNIPKDFQMRFPVDCSDVTPSAKSFKNKWLDYSYFLLTPKNVITKLTNINTINGSKPKAQL